MPMLDVWDVTQVTRIMRRNIEEQANAADGGENREFFGQQIAPLVTEPNTVTRIRIGDILPYSLGQFMDRDGTPPLWKAKPTIRETVIELVTIGEMERFTPDEWKMLTTADDLVTAGAVLSLADRLRIMQLRNERLTEWMRWQAFKGSLSITYPTDGAITVDYGFASSHLPTASTAWTDLTNADPVADLYAWSQVGADDAGRYYSKVHLNTNTFRLVQYNAKLRSYLSALGRTIMLPTRADLQQLMREGTANFEIIDSGYLPENATNRRLTKFLPDNRVLLTTEYTLFGEKIADMADGQVLVGNRTDQWPSLRQGMTAEIVVNPNSHQVFRRVKSARIPRLYLPEAFLYASVGA